MSDKTKVPGSSGAPERAESPVSGAPADPSASPSNPHDTRPEDRVGFWEKTALGSGFLPMFFGTAAVKSMVTPVYQMTLGLDPGILGAIMALPRIWDAVTDPIAGYISDNLHTRWGRRKPLIVIGAILQAFAFSIIWMVPETWGDWGLSAYLTVSLLLFYTCYTVFSVPLMSLTYEMTPDYKERTRVSAFGAFFGKIGELMYSWVFPLSQAAIFGSVMFGVRSMGWIVGLFIMGFVAMLPGLFVKERYYVKAEKQDRVPLLRTMGESFKNKAFLVLVGLTVCQLLAGMFASSIDYYLLVYYMCDGDIAQGSIWKGVLSTGYAVVGIVGIYPVNWLANRYGKRSAMSIIFTFVLIGAIAKWFIYTPGNNWKILIDPIFCGPVWIAINILTTSMFADICDEDELKYGKRREGVFGAAFSWIQKTGISLSMAGSFWVLNWVGFDEQLGADQPENTIFYLRLILAGSTALWAIIAMGLLAIYPLSAERAYEIRDELEARRGKVT